MSIETVLRKIGYGGLRVWAVKYLVPINHIP